MELATLDLHGCGSKPWKPLVNLKIGGYMGVHPPHGEKCMRGLEKSEKVRLMWLWGKTPLVTPQCTSDIPTKIGPEMGGEFTYQPTWDPIGFDQRIMCCHK